MSDDDELGPAEESMWLRASKRLRAIAQTGLAYARDPFDRERYGEVEGLALELIADLMSSTPDQVRRAWHPTTGYPTPKIDVRAGVVHEGRVLLVKERADGRWAFPGGWADEHDAPSENIVREVREESGYHVRVRKLVALKDRHLHPYATHYLTRVYKLLFLCELVSGEAETSIETDAVGWFPPDALPPLSRGRTIADDVAMIVANLDDPGRPTYFD